MGRNNKDFGVIKPVAGSDAEIAASEQKRTKARAKNPEATGTTFLKKDETSSSPVVAEETIREGDVGAPSNARAPKRPDTIPRGPRGAGSESGGTRLKQTTGGYRARTKDVTIPLSRMHKTYSTAINTTKSIKGLSESDQSWTDAASTHLMNSVVSMHKAKTEGGLHTADQDNDIAHGHLQDAVKHLSYAHETLAQSGLHGLAHAHSLTTPMPKDSEVAELSAKAQTLERRGVKGVEGATKSFQKPIPMGRGSVDMKEYTKADVDAIAREHGREHPGVQKLYAGLGTRRGQGQGLIGKSAVGEEGTGNAQGLVRSTQRVDPRHRASSKSVETRFSTQSNPSRNTPQPGESGKSGVIKGERNKPESTPTTVKPGIDQPNPNSAAKEASEAIRKIPSGKPSTKPKILRKGRLT